MLLLFSPSNSPSFNLAAEEFLFNGSTDTLLLLYVNNSSVIIGNNQVVQNEVNVDFCLENNVQIQRRMSGGGAVYHDFGNLNFCFISDRVEGKSALNGDFLQPIVDVLHTLNVPASIGVRKDIWLPGGFKISGTASHVSKNRELHHGTLLFNADLNLLNKVLSSEKKNTLLKGTVSVPSEVKNICSFSAWLKSDSFVTEFVIALENYYKTQMRKLDNDPEIQLLAQNKYESVEWIFKK